jgi:hypothetical protein
MGTHEELLSTSELYNEILGSQIYAEQSIVAGSTRDLEDYGSPSRDRE